MYYIMITPHHSKGDFIMVIENFKVSFVCLWAILSLISWNADFCFIWKLKYVFPIFISMFGSKNLQDQYADIS